MKKSFSHFSHLFIRLSASLITILLSLYFISCATLQQDVYTYSEDNNYIYTSIEIYEYQFITLDCKYHLETETPAQEINTLLKEINSYRNSTKVTEPFLIARLQAFEGLLNKMAGKNRDAQSCWQEAYNLQKGDSYVQLLSSRLNKNLEDALKQLEATLAFDSNNAVLLLEKGKLLYKLEKYDQAIAAMDNAFMLFDSQGLSDYRRAYYPLRESAWEMNKNEGEEVSSLPAGIELPDPITRRFCARYIWKTWVRKNGNLKMFTRYSDKYKSSGRSKSPVPDVSVEDEDFDAILGVVEKEFMELPDGRNFFPDEEVTEAQFLKWLKNSEK